VCGPKYNARTSPVDHQQRYEANSGNLTTMLSFQPLPAASIRLHVRFGDSTVLDLETNVIFLEKYVPRPRCVPPMFSLLVTKNLMRLSEPAPEPIRRAPKAILRLGSGQHFLSASFGLVGKDEHINERICKSGNGRNQSQKQ